MDKTKNIYVLITLSVCIIVLCGVFFLAFQTGWMRSQSEQENAAIDRLNDLNDKFQSKMDSNLVVVRETKAAIDSFMILEEGRAFQEYERIENSRKLVSQIPHMSNDSIKKVYNNSWNYLLNEYRSGRLMPAK